MSIYEKTGNILENLSTLLKDRNYVVTSILGAGASASVAPSTDTIRTKLLGKGGVPIEVLDTHARYNFGRFSANNCTLEELFSIYTHLKELKGEDPEKAIPDFLQRESIEIPSFDFKKELPPTGYEYVAHLVHHKSIANIITPNFDELLEISLNEEIGKNEYRYIISLSEFGAFRDSMGQKPKKELYQTPNLIKIHGTISRLLTLRWTIEKVKSFEKAKSDVLKKIFGDTEVMIIAGYSFRDTDLKNLFFGTVKDRQGGKKLLLYWIDTASEDDFIKDNEVYEKIQTEYLGKIELHCAKSNSDEFFTDICKKLRIDDTSQPTIARHKVRMKILKEKPTLDESSLDMKRLLTEVIIYAIKTRGIFELQALARCQRIENYCKRLSESPREILKKLCESNILNRMYLDEHEIYFIPGEENIDKTLQALSEKIRALFKFELWSPPEVTELKGLLEELKNDFDIDIGPPDENLRLMFYSPDFTSNHKGAIERANNIIKNSDNLLLIVAETGEWLTRTIYGTRKDFQEFLRKPNAKAKLILSAPFLEKPALHILIQKEKLEELKNIEREVTQKVQNEKIEFKYLLWDEHIYHMILNEKEGHFFARLGKSSSINPAYIKERDHKGLKDIFDRLWGIAFDYNEIPKILGYRRTIKYDE